MKLLRTVLSTSVALTLLAQGFSVQAEETIKIGLQGPLTGGSAPMGVSMRDGALVDDAPLTGPLPVAAGGLGGLEG